jgi:hypothetical protein
LQGGTVRRGAGWIAAIVVIAAALGVGYPAAATSPKGHHAQCGKASKSKVKRAERRAKCKKPRAKPHGGRSLVKGPTPTGTGTTTGTGTGTGAGATGTGTGTTGGGTTTGGGATTTGTGEGTTTGPGGGQVPKPLPAGISVITFQRTEETTGPEAEKSRVVKTGAITEPKPVAEVIDLLNSEKELPANMPISCPGLVPGTRWVRFELQFRDSLEGEPVVTAEASNPSCGGVMAVTVGSNRATRRWGSQSVVALAEQLVAHGA